MKLAMKAVNFTKETLAFARQFGVTHLSINAKDFLDEHQRGSVQLPKLMEAKKTIESYGLNIGVVLLPFDEGSLFWNVRLGTPGRDKEIKDVCRSIEILGKVGIPVVEYVFGLTDCTPGSVEKATGRGGAIIRHFDLNKLKEEPIDLELKATEEEMWDRLTYFLERVVPVAEKAGVRLACHPNDPPVSPVRGETRILNSFDGMKRLIETIPSKANGLNFCQGTVAQMGEDVIKAIKYFGSRDKINHVHFRNIRGSLPVFDETFIDNGDTDMLEAMCAYKESGYTGTIMPDHTPGTIDDSIWYSEKFKLSRAFGGHRGRAFALGYMKALMQAVGV